MIITYETKSKKYIVGANVFSTEDFIDYIKAGMLEQVLNQEKTDFRVSEPNSIDFKNSEDVVIDGDFYEKQQTPTQSLNRIFFGAPGTGKSYGLNKDAEFLILNSERTDENLSSQRNEKIAQHLERVTFYPDYTYSQFVGAYKPITVSADNESEDEGKNNSKKQISYEFVPGPFVRILKNALRHPKENYVLAVEEINRAKAPAVFGDIFQLLDRNNKGVSEYSVQISDELYNYFRDKHKLVLKNKEMRLPSNLYIWATMNSADQGVFPLDTAFKRRWDFKYIGIDDEEKKLIENEKLKEGENNGKIRQYSVMGIAVEWNELRKAINKDLSEKFKVKEDKLLGPFFIKPYELKNPAEFADLFCNKVLMYLYDDVLKMNNKNDFFGLDGSQRFSDVVEKFNSSGLSIFKSKNLKEYVAKLMTEQKKNPDDSGAGN